MNEKNMISQLDEESAHLIEKLSSSETKEERATILDEIEQLSKIRNERLKIENEAIQGEKTLKEEIRKNEQKIKDDKRDMWIKVATTILEIGVPALTYGLWAYASFKFEETGTIRSPVSKNIGSRMKATK